MSIFDVCGWLGAFCFAICAIPQAFKSYQDGNSHGISWGFLSLWLLGEVCMTIYVLPRFDKPLLVNYFGNFLCVIAILYFKLFPRVK